MLGIVGRLMWVWVQGVSVGTRGTWASKVLGVPVVPVLMTGLEVDPGLDAEIRGTAETDGTDEEGAAVRPTVCCWTAA